MKRHVAKERPPPLKIRKCVHRRQPLIIYAFSPEVISVEACNFMKLVQTLTGESSAASPLPEKPKASVASDCPSLISMESLNLPATSSSLSLSSTEDVLSVETQEEESPYFGNPNLNGKRSRSRRSIQNLNCNPGADSTLCPSRISLENPNPNPNNPFFSRPSTATMLPPFVKPSSLFNQSHSCKLDSSLLSPPQVDDYFVFSPSFDPSPNDLSTFLPNSPLLPLKDMPHGFVS